MTVLQVIHLSKNETKKNQIESRTCTSLVLVPTTSVYMNTIQANNGPFGRVTPVVLFRFQARLHRKSHN
jgi:hypothetical protein